MSGSYPVDVKAKPTLRWVGRAVAGTVSRIVWLSTGRTKGLAGVFPVD
jgi:hypothetical protein